jgi:hypothetical protein
MDRILRCVLGIGLSGCMCMAADTAYAATPPGDDSRTAVLIGSSVAFGIGGLVTGAGYLIRHGNRNDTLGGATDPHRATPWLVGYATIVGVTPSIPRAYVGRSDMALLLTLLRAASVTAAALVPWGDGRAGVVGPMALGFLAPITLGIVDLSTTPRRPFEGAATWTIAPIITGRPGGTGGGLAWVGRF